MHARKALGFIALAALLGACNEHDDRSPSRTVAPTPPIVVLHDDGSLPPRCGVRRAVARVAAFVDAFNRGDAEQLDRAIAERERFQWYWASEGHGKRVRAFEANGLTSAVAGDDGAPDHTDGRPEALRYLMSRHQAGERMRLLQVRVTHIPPRGWFPSIEYDVAGVDYSIRIDAPDLAAFPGRNRIGSGKGGFGCSDGRLLAWTIGLDTAGAQEQRAARTCRRGSRVRSDPGSKPRVLACSG